MKNKMILIPIFIVIVTIITGIIVLLPKQNNDNKQFKKDYGEEVPKGTSIIYLTDDNVVEALSTDDKLVFLGKTSSEGTKEAVKTLLSVAKYNGIDKIYYYDTQEIETKDEILKSITEKTNKKEIISPTLFLLKNKEVENIEEGTSADIEEKYDDIMISYIMCTTPDC